MLCAHAAVPASITATALATAINLECIAASVDRRSLAPTQRVRRRPCSVRKAARALPWRRNSAPTRAARLREFFSVIAGLDPAIHPFRKESCEEDGPAGQARG